MQNTGVHTKRCKEAIELIWNFNIYKWEHAADIVQAGNLRDNAKDVRCKYFNFLSILSTDDLPVNIMKPPRENNHLQNHNIPELLCDIHHRCPHSRDVQWPRIPYARRYDLWSENAAKTNSFYGIWAIWWCHLATHTELWRRGHRNI